MLAAGGAVVIYPEGTLTRDPDRLADAREDRRGAAGAEHRGPADPGGALGGPGALRHLRAKLPKFFPRKRYQLTVGEPIDLSDLRSGPMTRTVLTEATERIEAALTEGVAELRGEAAPELIWDRSLRQRVPRREPRRAPRAASAASPTAEIPQPPTAQPPAAQPPTIRPDDAQEGQS